MSQPQIGIINLLPHEHPDALLRQAIGVALGTGAPEPLLLHLDAPSSELQRADVLLLAAPSSELNALAQRGIRLGLDLFIANAAHLTAQELSTLAPLAREARARVGLGGLMLPLRPTALELPPVATVIVEGRRHLPAVGQRAALTADLGTLLRLFDSSIAVRSMRLHTAGSAALMVLVEMANGSLISYLQQRDEHPTGLQIELHGAEGTTTLMEEPEMPPLAYELGLLLASDEMDASPMLNLAMRTAMLVERIAATTDARGSNILDQSPL